MSASTSSAAAPSKRFLLMLPPLAIVAFVVYSSSIVPEESPDDKWVTNHAIEDDRMVLPTFVSSPLPSTLEPLIDQEEALPIQVPLSPPSTLTEASPNATTAPASAEYIPPFANPFKANFLPADYLPLSQGYQPLLTSTIWFPSNPPPGESLKVVFGIHGGGLVVGSPDEMPWWLIQQAEVNNWVLVGLEYRLLFGDEGSSGGAKGSLKDCVDQIDAALGGGELQRTIEEMGSNAVVDAESFGIAGFSAGAYLTLLISTQTKIKPSFAITLYPAVQLLSQFFSHTSRLPTYRYVLNLSPSFMLNTAKWIHRLWSEPILTSAESTPGYKEAVLDGGEGAREMIWFGAVQAGVVPDILLGGKGLEEDGSVRPYGTPQEMTSAIKEILPLRTPGLSLKRDFPPLWILHGAVDVICPPEDSRWVKMTLDEAGVECHHEEIPGAFHGFDLAFDSGNLVDWKEIGDWANSKFHS